MKMTIRDLIPWKRDETKMPIHQKEEDSFMSLQSEINRLFDSFFTSPFSLTSHDISYKTFTPSIDVIETEDAYKITAELPGMDEDDITVTLDRNYLTLSGEKTTKVEDKDEHYHRVERSYGSFRRSIVIPEEVDTDNIKAQFKNGLLSINLPKKPEAQRQSRRIKVKTA
jgi:HSP20 family protein